MQEQRPITLYILAIVLVEALVVLIVATPSFIAESKKSEREGLVWLLGDVGANDAARFSKKYFKAHFLDTDIRDLSYDVFIPTQNKKERANLENFVPTFFEAAKRRFDGWWMMIEGAYTRVYTIVQIILIFMIAIIGAVVDGISRRGAAIAKKEHSVPVYYHAAKRAFLLLALLPIFILLWPVSVHPVVWLTWGLCIPAALWVSFRNVQEL
ncbi:MAG: DUF4400 domain-containing protein [Pseudomonadales bacterium]|nr:DUF4400 domain-containing protein [Pseudomonadales bacterium]